MTQLPPPLPIGLMPRAGAGYCQDLVVELASTENWRRRVLARPDVLRHWFLGDSATAPAIDEVTRPTGGAGNGVYVGGPTTARGMLPEFGLATRFDGVDDGANVPTGLSGNVTFTVVLWVRPAAIGAYALIFSTGDAAASCPTVGHLAGGALYFGTGTAGNYFQMATPTLVVNRSCFIAASYTPGGQSRISLAVDGGPLASATAALAAFGPHGPGAIGGQSGYPRFNGDIQGVAVFTSALTVADLEQLRAAGAWEPLLDVEGSESLILDSGIHEDNPLTRIAGSGTCTLVLDNSERNSVGALGYYTPGHVNARAGWDRGAMLRVSALTSSGALVPQFLGQVRTIRPDAGIYSERRVQVLATDWLDEAARRPVQGVPTLTNVRADDVIRRVLDAMRNRPHALSLAVGSDAYPFALDVTSESEETVFNELKRLADSERGLIYLRGDGTLVFESRYTRAYLSTKQFDVLDVQSAELTRASEDVINRVEVTIHPRRADATATVVLYSADTPQQYDATDSPTFVSLPFRDPTQEAVQIGGMDLQPLTPTTDYVINTQADGAGQDLTSSPDITITMFAEATGVRFLVHNRTGAAIHFTKLQVRGRGLYHYDPITVFAENAASVDAEGVQRATFDMPYQVRIGVADATARQLLATFNETPTRVDAVPFWLFQNPDLERLGIDGGCSTRVRFAEPMGAIDRDFFVNAKKLDCQPAGDVTVTLWLTPAAMNTFAIFDTSRFDDPGSRFAY